MNGVDIWKPNQDNARTFRGMAILYGSSRGGSLAEHSHPEAQVSIHFRAGQTREMMTSHVNLCAAHQPHTGGWRHGFEVVVLHISPELLLETRQEMSQGNNVEIIPARETRDSVLEGLGSIIRDEYQQPDRLSNFYIESVGHVAVQYILRKHASIVSSPTGGNGLSDVELDSLRRYIEDSLPKGFAARDLAEGAGLSPARFAERLKVSTGLSPWRFVQEHRICLAKLLLKNRKISLVEIAVRLGFADQSHLTNRFRAATGTTPDAYRADRR